MGKARKFGWTGQVFSTLDSEDRERKLNGDVGYVDSWDALVECLDELEKEKILPPSKNAQY